MHHTNIPLGMCLSVEKSAKKIMASRRDASFRRRETHPYGMRQEGGGLFLPRDASLTGCKTGAVLM